MARSNQKSQRLLIISKETNLYVIKRLKSAGKKDFDKVDVLRYRDIKISNTEKEVVTIAGKPLSYYTHIISRVADKHYMLRYFLALEAKRLNIRMLNREAIIQMPIYNKAYQLYKFSISGIPLPKTEFSYKKELITIKPPLLKKRIDGRLSRGIKKIEGLGDNSHSDFQESIFQSFLVNDFDYRILIMDGKLIGAVERSSRYSDNKTESRACDISEDSLEVKLAKKVALCMNLEYVGVDVMKAGREAFVLEANIDAGIKGFERVTKKDLASMIIQQVLDEK